MARLLLRVFSAQRSLHRPVPKGSCARLSSFQYANLPKIVCLLLIVWSTRPTYASVSPPVLVALEKLRLVPGKFGCAINLFSRKAAVCLIEPDRSLLRICCRIPVICLDESGMKIRGMGVHWRCDHL